MKRAKSKQSKQSNGRLRKVLLSKQFCITVLVLMSLLALICLVKLILGFMPVKHFTYEGETHYDISELISASDIRTGDRLYKINDKAAVASMVRECPYLKTVKIKKKFPNTVCFVVEEQEPGWYVQVGKDFYGLDFDMKVLLETYIEEDFVDRGLTKLTLPEIETVIVGELPSFASDDEQLMKETLKIVDSFRTHEIKERLTGLDISNRFEIKLEIDNSYEVYFGDMTSFEIKMKALIMVLSESAEKYGFTGGSIMWDETSSSFALRGKTEEPSEEDEDGENKDGNGDFPESDIINEDFS